MDEKRPADAAGHCVGDHLAPAGFQFSEENVQRLKEKYMSEMKRGPGAGGAMDASNENPMKACMRIMFQAASERNPERRAELALELSKLLIKPDGLINLFLALIDFDTSSQQTTTHNQRFLAVANIIAHLPKLCLPYVEYCDNLRRQLRLILIHHETKYSSLASLILKALLESPHANKLRKQVEQVVIDPFTRPLELICDDLKLHHAILAIHNLVQNRLPTRLFIRVFPNLFYSLVKLNDTPSQLKTHLRTILTNILNDLQAGPACCMLEQTIFHPTECASNYSLLADEDQITLVLSDSAEPANFELIKRVTLKLLESCDNELLVLEFFFHFQAKMWTSSVNCEVGLQCASLIEPLLEQTIEENPSNKLDLLTSIISNGQQALELISRTLLNYLDFLRMYRHEGKTEQDTSESENLVDPSLSSCLDILEVLLATLERKPRTKLAQSKIVNTLREIKSLLENRPMRRDVKLEQNLGSLIEKLSTDDDWDDFQAPKATNLADREYNEAMRDLNDKLVPVRVHALVRLKNLILAGDRCTVARISQLYSMIECSLADQEPYVFLASINLLAEMGLRKTDDLLPRLMELYSRQDLEMRQRINVGEVLMRLVRRLDAMTPFYAQTIMAAFLASTQSDEELVRVSSLSNVGEICHNLGDSLGKYMVEILSCVERILESDTIQTKCAAVALLRSALMGLDGPRVETIQREMKSIYGLLKKLRQRTLDEKICLQVDLALDEIGRLAKELLGHGGDRQRSSCEALVKNVKVLSLLD